MKSTFKFLFLLCALSPTLSGCSESELEAAKALAESGDAIAQYNLGVMYDDGSVRVAEDDQEAVKWYRLAAEQGNAEAQFRLGNIYKGGIGVAQNDQEALKWYRLAAEQGNVEAQIDLGIIYENGTGVAQNDQEAVKWYRLAAEQGNGLARIVLDRLLREPRVNRLYFEAAKALADAGDVEAQASLGRRYANGDGVAEDDQEAVKWFRLAAEQGLASAQHNLGTMYRNGEGVVQNDQEAVKWYRLAAEQGLVYGQLDLGRMYRDGTFVAKDNLRAYVWFSVAATTRETFYNSFANHIAVEERDETRQLLSPQALEAAQAQATRCFESNFKDCD